MREVYIQIVKEAEEGQEEHDESSGHVSAERAHTPYLLVIYVMCDERDTKQEGHDV
jgi:hypothetical protein